MQYKLPNEKYSSSKRKMDQYNSECIASVKRVEKAPQINSNIQ